MISLFDKELMRMEQEVRDLKTIHQRGLGTTRFYTYEREITIPDEYDRFSLQATVEDPSLLPIVIFPYMEYVGAINFIIGYTDDSFMIGGVASRGTVVVKIITSQPLENITTWTGPWD